MPNHIQSLLVSQEKAKLCESSCCVAPCKGKDLLKNLIPRHKHLSRIPLHGILFLPYILCEKEFLMFANHPIPIKTLANVAKDDFSLRKSLTFAKDGIYIFSTEESSHPCSQTILYPLNRLRSLRSLRTSLSFF